MSCRIFSLSMILRDEIACEVGIFAVRFGNADATTEYKYKTISIENEKSWAFFF